MKQQTVFMPVKVKDELTEKEVCGLSRNNEMLVGHLKSTKHSYTGFDVSDSATNLTNVDRWLKPQEGYFFTEEQLKQMLSNYTDKIVESVKVDGFMGLAKMTETAIRNQLTEFLKKLI